MDGRGKNGWMDRPMTGGQVRGRTKVSGRDGEVRQGKGGRGKASGP